MEGERERGRRRDGEGKRDREEKGKKKGLEHRDGTEGEREEKRGKGGYAGNANARHFHPVDGRFVLRSAKEFVKSLERLDSVPDTRLARSRATPRGKAAVSSVEFSKPGVR